MNPQLHAFFLDAEAAPDFIHADIVQLYSRVTEPAGDQHELIAYSEEFEGLLDYVQDLVRDPDEGFDGPYLARLTEFRDELRTLDTRRARVSDLQIEIRQSLEEIEELRIRYGEGLLAGDDPSYDSWLDARQRTLAEVERLRADPDMAPHLDRVLTNLAELANAATPATLAEAAAAAASPPAPAPNETASVAPAADAGLPSQAETATVHAPQNDRPLVWAGIGSRGNAREPMPPSVLADMTELARRMAAAGWHLSSGGADGSDTAFANGTPVDQRTIWVPWAGYNDLSGPDCHPIPRDRLQQSLDLAERIHPAWDKCSQGMRKLHARNGLILLGRDLDRPVDAVVAYTQGGKLQGGTAQGLRLAMEHNIPIFNLGSMTMEQAWEKLQALQRSLRPDAAVRSNTESTSAGADDLKEGMARVWHLRNAPPDAIRIDRQTRWGNPFVMGKDGTREEVIDKYRDHLWGQIRTGKLSLDDLAGLHGKDLACHCAPQPCHGDVLSKAAAWANTNRNRTASRTADEERRADPGARPATDPAAEYEPLNYDADTACVFRFSRDEWGVFSNFFPSIQAIKAAGHTFNTSEHLYQAAKFRGSPDVQARIAAASSARDAAAMGRDTANPPDADWNGRRMNAMRWVIRMKREANTELVDAALQKTGDRPIVEFSRHDSFWGAQPQGNNLVGQNILGRLWMELRQHIRDGDPRALASAWEDPLTPKTAARAPAAQTAEADLPAALGLVTTHRRLLEAAQDGWLHPVEGRAFLLARDGAVSEDLAAGDHPIHLRLTFDPRKFPFPALRAELSRAAAGEDAAAALSWGAPIPLFAVTKIEVGTEQDKARLLALSGQFSNVTLPAAEIVSTGNPIAAGLRGPAASSEIPALQLPERLNAAQGSLAMAVWALPKEEGWSPVLETLLHATGSKPDRITPDWFALPWDSARSAMPSRPATADQRRLWDAAVSCLQWPGAESRPAAALATEIARAASADAPNAVAERWLEQTQKIISAEEMIAYGGSTDERAGLAIQLALLRPEPYQFQSWPEAMPELPQSVVWAGAALCGWRHGYHNLDNAFRGDTALQETIATRALANIVPSACAPAWAAAHEDPATVADTWQRIKTDYASLYRTSGDRIQHLPYQQGFAGFRDLVAGAVQDGACPPEHRDRLKALHETLEIQASRHDTVSDAASRLEDAFSRLQDLKEKANSEEGHTIETMPGYTAWLRDRDAAVARWHELAADPAHREHKEHMQIVAPDMMAPLIAELSNGPLASIHQPRADYPVPSPGQDVYTPSLQPLSRVYDRAMAFVDRDPNLLPYAPQFDELKAALSTALHECSHTPDLVTKLTALRTTLDENQEHKNRAQTLADNVSRASHTLCSLNSWAAHAGKPVHEAPRFNTWREEADRALNDYEAAKTDPALAVHLARADSLGVLSETAVPMLRDDRFRKPVATAASLAAGRQRSEEAEEQYSMSA